MRIGPDCWLGEGDRHPRNVYQPRLRPGINAVIRGEIPPESVVGDTRAVLKNRREVYDTKAAHRAALADIKRKTAAAAEAHAQQRAER